MIIELQLLMRRLNVRWGEIEVIQPPKQHVSHHLTFTFIKWKIYLAVWTVIWLWNILYVFCGVDKIMFSLITVLYWGIGLVILNMYVILDISERTLKLCHNCSRLRKSIMFFVAVKKLCTLIWTFFMWTYINVWYWYVYYI